MPDDERERPKRSWREADLNRDRAGGGRRAPKPTNQRTLKGGAAKRYMAQLDRVFSGGGLPEQLKQQAPNLGAFQKTEHRVRTDAVLAATSPSEIASAVDELLANHEMPEDAELLAKILAHPKGSHAQPALESLVEILDRGKPANALLLKTRLQSLKLTAEDDEIDRLADIALAML